MFWFGIPDAILGFDLRISLSRQFVILPAMIFVKVPCLNWIAEPSERPVFLFVRLIGKVIAPPMLGM